MQIFNYLEFIKEALIDYDQDLIRIFSKLTRHHDKDVSSVAYNLIDICHTEIDSRTLRNTEYKFKLGSTDQSISLDGKNEIKVGRLIGILLPKVPDHIKGKFTSAFMSASLPPEQEKDEFEIITGKDIKEYYSSNNCTLKGTLASSCMLDAEDILDIYCENPESVSLLVYKSEGDDKISGRAILWNLDNNQKLVDRIYYASDDIIDKFINWAREKDYLFRRYQSTENKTIIDKSGNDHKDVTVKLKKFNFFSYPYLDTMCFLDMTDGTLRQKLSGKEKLYYHLNHTGGFFDAVDNGAFRVLADYVGSPIGLLRRRGATLIDIYTNQSDMESLDNAISTWAVKSAKQMEVDVRNYYYENSEEYDINFANYIPKTLPQKVLKQVVDKLIGDLKHPESPNAIKYFNIISNDCVDKIKPILKESYEFIMKTVYDEEDRERLIARFGSLNLDDSSKLSEYIRSIYTLIERRSSAMNSIVNLTRERVIPFFEAEIQSNSELINEMCTRGDSWVFDGAVNWPNLVTDLVEEQWTSTEKMFKMLYFADMSTSIKVGDIEYLLGEYKERR